MPRSFDLRLTLARAELDRDHTTRDEPELLERLLADAATRVIVLTGGTVLLDAEGGLALLHPDAAPDHELALYLGRALLDDEDAAAGTPIVALVVGDAGHLAEASWGDLRQIATTLDDRDAGLATEAIALANWHRVHGFSPRTGEPTTSVKGGWVRVDPSGYEHFPRTDPAIIVGITDADDRILLGSNALWESNRYSLLAGFVEPGESLESAVRREVFEEAGVRVVDPEYLGSQPWPFPASLMLGFRARLDDAEPQQLQADGEEIRHLRWFSRDEIVAAVAAGEVRLPGPVSIARAILDDWFGGTIPDGQ